MKKTPKNHAIPPGSMLEAEVNAQEEADREAWIQRQVEAARWERVFFTPDGARVLHALLDECNIFGTSFTGNSNTFFLEGKRAVGLWIMQQLDLMNIKKLAEIFSAIPDEGDENERRD